MEKKLSAEEWMNVLENEADERYKKTSENLEHYAFRCGAEWSMQFWRGEAVSDAVEALINLYNATGRGNKLHIEKAREKALQIINKSKTKTNE